MSTGIKERIEQRQSEARAAVTAEAWQDEPDEQRIVDAALRGGLSADDADGIVEGVQAAKATLKELNGIDLAGLKSARDDATKAQDAAAKKYADAQAAFEQASEQAADAGQAYDDGLQRYRAAAIQARNGTIPADRVPDAVKRIVAYDMAVDAQQRGEGQVRQLRIDRQRLKSDLATLETRATAMERDKKAFPQHRIVGGNLVPSDTGVAAQVKALKKQLKAVEKKLTAAPAEQAELVAAVESARQAIA